MTRLLSRPPERLHHHAYVVKDQEANRRFFEDVLGIPLTATWCERHFNPWVNRDVAFCHTFYSLGDSGALAFFSFADDEVYRKCQAERPPEIGNFDHIAFKVDDAIYDELLARVEAAGEPVRESDHGYCRSIYCRSPYCRSPDGLIVEFTVDPPNAAQIDAARRVNAHSELARWIAGDHRTNNDLRTHQAAE
ncbi:VOC family protein [Rhodopila sp.]|uniref:VOC family protein n=1 Tax=Rhodopila sp. TaxID=2480087 RepID=UPI003D140E27